MCCSMTFGWACCALTVFAAAFAMSFVVLGDVILQQHEAFAKGLLPHVKNTSATTPVEDPAQRQVSTCDSNPAANPDLSLRGKQKRAFLYMDELFHFEQILRYVVDANYSYYDPMITTPPGSYVPASIWLHLALGNEADKSLVPRDKRCHHCVGEHRFASLYCASCGLLDFLEQMCVEATRSSIACEVIGLRAPRTYAEALYSARMFGCIQHVAVGTLLSVILATKALPGTELIGLSSGLLSFLLPPVMFTTLLVYTDITSLAVVAALVILTPNGMARPTWKTRAGFFGVAFLGAYGIWCRQTNVVWLMFVAGRYCAERLFAEGCREGASTRKVVLRVVEALTALIPVILVGFGFAYFVLVINKGQIVLGDASSHQPVLHLSQIVYFFFAVTIFFPTQALSAASKILFGQSRNVCFALGVVFVMFALLLQHFAVLHKYLISDNRHYTFYLWRRVLQDEARRVCIISPIATIGFATFVDGIYHSAQPQSVLAKVKGTGAVAAAVPSMIATWRWVSIAEIWLLGLCVVVSCAPQALLELRYFVPPLVVMQLLRASRRQYEPRVDARIKVLDCVYLSLVHIATTAIFAYWTFTAPDGTAGRFMW